MTLARMTPKTGVIDINELRRWGHQVRYADAFAEAAYALPQLGWHRLFRAKARTRGVVRTLMLAWGNFSTFAR